MMAAGVPKAGGGKLPQLRVLHGSVTLSWLAMGGWLGQSYYARLKLPSITLALVRQAPFQASPRLG